MSTLRSSSLVELTTRTSTFESAEQPEEENRTSASYSLEFVAKNPEPSTSRVVISDLYTPYNADVSTTLRTVPTPMFDVSHVNESPKSESKHVDCHLEDVSLKYTTLEQLEKSKFVNIILDVPLYDVVTDVGDTEKLELPQEYSAVHFDAGPVIPEPLNSIC